MRKNPARYRVKKHSPNNTALPTTNATTAPVIRAGAALAASSPAGSGGFSRPSARNKQYTASKNSNMSRFVGNPETPYDHSVSEKSINQPTMVATRLSKSRLAQRYTINMDPSRQSWLNGRMPQRSAGKIWSASLYLNTLLGRILNTSASTNG